MRVRLVVLCLAVFLAGCSGFAVDEVTEPVDTGDETAVTNGNQSTAESATTDSVDNPWGTETITVGIVNTANESRDIEPLVAETIEYWNTDGSGYASYSVNFTLDPDKSDVDIMVLLKEEFDCGNRENNLTAGCAPRIDAGTTVTDRPQHVEIQSGHTDNATVTILKHEFGHVLGLGHADEPQSFMRTGIQLEKFPEPTYDERANPYGQETVNVHVDWESHSGDRAATERQLTETFSALESDIGPVSDVTFKRVETREAANITIEFDSGECGGAGQSCGVHEGIDEDGQGTLNRLTTTKIRLDDIEEKRQGWHVGYWVAHAFAGGETDDMPDVFANPRPNDQVDWWEG